jgi:outer membrane protein
MRRVFIFQILVGLLVTIAIAAPLPSQTQLSWEACVELARNANPDLKVAERNLTATEYSESGAKSGFFPQISSNLSYTYGNSGGSSGLLNGAESNASTSTSISLTATQNIFNGYLDQAKIDQARANRLAADANLSTAKAKLSFELKTAFAGIQFAQESIRLTSEIIKRREANLKLVELRYSGGRENKGALLLSRAYLEQALYEKLQAQNVLKNAQTQLAKVLGREDSEELSVQGSIPELTTSRAEVLERVKSIEPSKMFFDLKQIAYKTPEVALARAQEDSAMTQMELSSAGLYPTLSLSGTTGAVGSVWMPGTQRWSVGAALTIPLFGGGKDYYAKRSSGESAKAATLNRDSVFHQTLLRLQQTWTAYLEGTQKLRVDQTFAEALALREKIAKEKYNNGLMSFDDWDLIENDLISRQKVTIQTQREWLNAEAAWEQAQGHGVFQ